MTTTKEKTKKKNKPVTDEDCEKAMKKKYTEGSVMNLFGALKGKIFFENDKVLIDP